MCSRRSLDLLRRERHSIRPYSCIKGCSRYMAAEAVPCRVPRKQRGEEGNPRPFTIHPFDIYLPCLLTAHPPPRVLRGWGFGVCSARSPLRRMHTRVAPLTPTSGRSSSANSSHNSAPEVFTARHQTAAMAKSKGDVPQTDATSCIGKGSSLLNRASFG